MRQGDSGRKVVGGFVEDSFETRITRTILDAYHEKVARALVSDLLVVGAGP